MPPLRILARAAFAASLAAALPPVHAQPAGVGKNELLLGTIQDLSGPLAGYGKDLRNGMMLRIGEVNEQGGLHGRKLRLLVEDNGYDPKRAVIAAQKLTAKDGIFVMVGLLGAASANAAHPVLAQKNVMNFFPMALAKDMYEPVDKLKFAFVSSYIEQMQRAVPRLYREKKAARACTLYQDDDFGQEVVKGAELGLKSIGVDFAERTSYKRGATDFSSQVARLKAANCDFVVLGTLAEARRTGYNPTFITSVAAYTDLIPRLGGKAVEGLYSTMMAQVPYEDDASQPLRFWASKYRTASGDAPTVFSAYGYIIIDRLATALQKAGPAPTTDTLARTLEGMKVPADMFGMPAMAWSATNHLATPETRLSQVQNGRWKLVLDYDQMK